MVNKRIRAPIHKLNKSGQTIPFSFAVFAIISVRILPVRNQLFTKCTRQSRSAVTDTTNSTQTHWHCVWSPSSCCACTHAVTSNHTGLHNRNFIQINFPYAVNSNGEEFSINKCKAIDKGMQLQLQVAKFWTERRPESFTSMYGYGIRYMLLRRSHSHAQIQTLQQCVSKHVYQ